MSSGKKIVDKYTEPNFWRKLLTVWTLFLFAAIIWDFVGNNSLRGTLSSIAIIYTAILSIYSASKEFRRWYDFHTGRHPGELYVIAWTILLISVLLIDIATRRVYQIPDVIISTYVVVVGILAITKNSKKLYLERDENSAH